MKINYFILSGLFLFFGCNQGSQTQSTTEINKTSTVNTLKYPFHYRSGLNKLVSAHRGGGDIAGYPENAVESFQYLVEQCEAWIECDVRETADGVLFLMHDETLERTTTGFGSASERSWEYISDLKLKDNYGKITDFSPPSLEEVLTWNSEKGQTVLTLDIKPDVSYKDLLSQVKKHNQLEHCIAIVYSFNQAKALRKLNKDIVISLPIRGMDEWKRFEELGIEADRIIAFTGTRRSSRKLYDTLHKHGIISIFGTIGNIDRQAAARGDRIYRELADEGVDIFATDRPQACFSAISN
jgi:glycerophosphoryl diester phosphodiesterase